MKQISKQVSIFTCLAFATISLSGCFPLLVGAAAGAGGYSYFKGNYVQNIDFPVEKAHNAALDALRDTDYFITQDNVTRHLSKIEAESADGKKVKVDISALTEHASKVKIRVGLLGNELESARIMDKVIDKL